MKIERLVQVLFYILLTIITLGLCSYNGFPIIAPDIRNVVIYVVLGLIIAFLIYYFLPKKKKV